MANQIISLSGGKDSTAMLLMMLERKEPIHSVVFFDTGWDFPEMHTHIQKLKKYVWDRYQLKVWTLHPMLPFEYEMLHRPIRAKSGDNKGEIHRTGNSWPSPMRRWCTERKVRSIKYYSKFIENPIQCIGYASDELNRGVNNTQYQHRFPLQEYGVTEQQALNYCFEKGFDWGGLYKVFNRVSCFCCPLKNLPELRNLRTHYPKLWSKMLEWDAIMSDYNRGFYGHKTVHDLDRRFAEEDRQIELFAI